MMQHDELARWTYHSATPNLTPIATSSRVMATRGTHGASDPLSTNDSPFLPYEVYLLIAEAFLDGVEVALAESIKFDLDCNCTIDNGVFLRRLAEPRKEFWKWRFRLIQSISQVNQKTRGMAQRTMFPLPVVSCKGEEYLAWFCPKVDFMWLGRNPLAVSGDDFLPLPGLQNVTQLRFPTHRFLEGFCREELESLWATFPGLESFVLTTCCPRFPMANNGDDLLLVAGTLTGLGDWDGRERPRATWTAAWDRGIRVFIVQYLPGLDHQSIKPTAELVRTPRGVCLRWFRPGMR